MNLAVIGHDLVVDVKGASRSKGARAILWSANGATNQQFLRDDMGRLIPQHCPDNILDVKGDEIVWGAPLIFWPIKIPASSNQQFHLDESGRLLAGCSEGGDLAVGTADLSPGAQLALVPKASARALQFEWREAPPPASSTGTSHEEASSPPRRKSFWSRVGGGGSAYGVNGSSSSEATPPPANASSCASGAGSRGAEQNGEGRPQASKESSSSSSGGGDSKGALPEALTLALAADNYYESLGISASEKVGLNDAKVRRAYLKTSVKVHPDKHPSFPQESTVAFQRVSEAYAGLKDDEARRNYAAELRGTFGRGGHRGCAPSSSASDGGSGDGGGSGGQARGGRRGGNSNPQQQPWYQSSEGVSYKEAAAFFAAAFAAEAAAGQLGGGLGGNLGKGVKMASDVAEFGATLKMAEGLLKGEGSTANRVASGLMVANSVANLSSHLELLGPSAGRLGAGLGTFARAATAAVAVGSIAVAAREHGRLEAQKEQAAAERYYTGGQSSSYSNDDDDDDDDRGRGRPPGSKNVSKPSKYYPPETEF